jgi:hypothetical protein
MRAAAPRTASQYLFKQVLANRVDHLPSRPGVMVEEAA